MNRALARMQTLLQLDRELEGISIQTSDSRFVRSALRTLAESLEADVALQADYARGDAGIESGFQIALTRTGREILSPPGVPERVLTPSGFTSHPYSRAFDAAAIRIAVDRQIGDVPRSLLVAAIGIEDRRVAALGFARHGRDFSRDELRWLLDAAERVGRHLTARHRERARRLRERISTKIFSELRPKDVLYQTLHGLKKLFRYDHSGAVVLVSPDGASWTVQAEIVTWTKGKSERVGLERPLDPTVRDWLVQRRHPLLICDGAIANSGSEAGTVPAPEALLHTVLELPEDAPRARACLIGVLRRKDQLLGVIQLFARHTGAFSPEDERTLLKFLPLAAATVYNSELYAAQHDRMVSAERKVGLGELARAISHDLNNAFGVFLPLLQTVKRDIEAASTGERELNLERFREDIDVALHYAGYSARIFEGLLSMGRGPTEAFAWIDPNPLLQATLEMVAPNLVTRGIRLETDLTPVPRICARRGEIEQLLLNLLYNARDALSQGGTLRCSTRESEGGAMIEIADTGSGIPEDIREKIFEPFFTTKKEGTGLGLDICRSIVWEYGGRIELLPRPEGGTLARIWLPPSTERVPEELRWAHGPRVPVAAESRAEPTVGFRTSAPPRSDRGNVG